MELSSGQQRLLFVVVVLALGGLGIFLLGGRHRTAAPPPAHPSASAAPATSAPAPAQAYVAKMNGLVTTNFAASLQNSYATPGVAALRSAQKQISTSSGGIASIQSFGTRSITFAVNITQRLATTSGTTNSSKQYAVTVVSNATGWQVNDVEIAGAGNQ